MAARTGVPELGITSAGEPTDADLCLAAQAGDRRAFEGLVRRYQRPVFGLAVRILGHGEDARDAAQEVFVKAWFSIDRYDPERAFAPWILTIARNEYRDRLRRRVVRRGDVSRTDPQEVLGQVADPRPTVETELTDAQGLSHLEGALAGLPEHYREVVVLHHVQDRPVKEIAAILGRPQGTVMTWLYRARAALKDALIQKGVQS